MLHKLEEANRAAANWQRELIGVRDQAGFYKQQLEALKASLVQVACPYWQPPGHSPESGDQVAGEPRLPQVTLGKAQKRERAAVEETKALHQKLLLERQSAATALSHSRQDAKQWQQAAAKSCSVAEQAQKAQAAATEMRTKTEEERTAFHNVEGALRRELSDLKAAYSSACGRLSSYEAELVGPLTGYMDQGNSHARDPAGFVR
eukprot:9488629-Pyramimonas_sp.AAC.1